MGANQSGYVRAPGSRSVGTGPGTTIVGLVLSAVAIIALVLSALAFSRTNSQAGISNTELQMQLQLSLLGTLVGVNGSSRVPLTSGVCTNAATANTTTFTIARITYATYKAITIDIDPFTGFVKSQGVNLWCVSTNTSFDIASLIATGGEQVTVLFTIPQLANLTYSSSTFTPKFDGGFNGPNYFLGVASDHVQVVWNLPNTFSPVTNGWNFGGKLNVPLGYSAL
jgi:hypothetical protein